MKAQQNNFTAALVPCDICQTPFEYQGPINISDFQAGSFAIFCPACEAGLQQLSDMIVDDAAPTLSTPHNKNGFTCLRPDSPKLMPDTFGEFSDPEIITLAVKVPKKKWPKAVRKVYKSAKRDRTQPKTVSYYTWPDGIEACFTYPSHMCSPLNEWLINSYRISANVIALGGVG